MKLLTTAVLATAVLALAACQPKNSGRDGSSQLTAATLQVDFTWVGTEACSSDSPAFTIGGVPEGTTRLRFAMKDLDVPTYNHGGGTVGFSGSPDIPAGAFAYKGPCPPSGSHRYQWTVQALDAGGEIIGEGYATQAFPP
ncbi:MAG: YbhB/YbcL family Raf kinase inhibitor-like protein [Kiloniellales bacterium]